eukprot:m.412702 g.412702  ORF g.412702 m.412702 type:complete len:433 (+) comp21258_c0_seq6:60-1358(+)
MIPTCNVLNNGAWVWLLCGGPSGQKGPMRPHVPAVAGARGGTRSTGRRCTAAAGGRARGRRRRRRQQVRVLERLPRRHARRRVDVQQSGEEVDKHGVVRGGVSGVACTSATGTARLGAEHCRQLAHPRWHVRLGRSGAHPLRFTGVGLAEILSALFAFSEQVRWEDARQLSNLHHLVQFTRAVEDGVTRVQLVQNASHRPHVDLLVIRQPQEHFGRAVEPRLNIRVHRFANLARTSKVNKLDGGAFRILQQDILWLQITVNDLDSRRREEQERVEHLLRKLAYEIERDALEARVADQIVEVVREMLKDQAKVVAVDECAQEPYDVTLILTVDAVHLFEQFDFNLRLVAERRLVLNHFDGHLDFLLAVHRLCYLTERPTAQQPLDVIPVVPHLARLDNVVVILIVIPIVPCFLVLSRTLCSIVHFVDVLVSVY